MTKNTIQINKAVLLYIVIGIILFIGGIIYYINNNKSVAKYEPGDDEIKAKLRQIKSNPTINSDVKTELAEIEKLLDIKASTKAIFFVAKVIENLLNRLYKDDQAFKDSYKIENPKKGKPVFADFLEYAKKTKTISKEQYHHISALKEIRNEEGHCLGVIREKLALVSSFLIGFNVILSLSNLLYMRKNGDNLLPC